MKNSNGLKGVIMALLIALIIGAVVYRFANNSKNEHELEDLVELTPIEIALQKNLVTDYPQTPKEVVKCFAEFSKCFYNEEFESDEQLVELADKMLELYDDELVGYNDHDNYIFDLKTQIKFYKESNYKLSNYRPSASTDVEYFSQDGYEWARTWCIFTVKSGKYYKDLNECFMLRKDDKGHWRIYGWEEIDE